jgi:hypothetical protein
MQAVKADSLAQSVVPLFVPHDQDPERPERAGSCVLVRLFDRDFVVTARHVFGDRTRQEYFLGRRGSNLITFTVPGMFTVKSADEDLDVAVIALTPTQTASLAGLVFIPEESVEIKAGQPSPRDEYVVFGFPDSHAQFRLDRPHRNIRQKSFYFRTGAARSEISASEGFNHDTHLAVEFDPQWITVDGKRHNPPKPRGISGGAVFHMVNGTLRLAGILTAHRKASRAMISVRMSEVVAIADHVIHLEPRLQKPWR